MKNFKLMMMTLMMSLSFMASFGQSTIANGESCPDFTETDVNGVEQNLYSYCDDGKYVILYFFTHWCGPCLVPSLHLHNFYTKYGCNEGDVIVIGIEGDANSTLEQLQQFKIDAGIPNSSFPSVLGSAGGSGVRWQYGVYPYPTSVLIGPDKKMINNDIWPIAGVETYENAFTVGAISEMSCSSASIDQNALKVGLSLFPNPVSKGEEIHIKTQDFLLRSWSLFSVSGHLCLVGQGQGDILIKTGNLSVGVYYINIEDGAKIVTKRIVIQ